MMKFKIEKGIPLVKKMNSSGLAEAIKKLKITDSFECEVKHRYGCYSAAHFHKVKIAIRKTDKNSGMIRVWRIK